MEASLVPPLPGHRAASVPAEAPVTDDYVNQVMKAMSLIGRGADQAIFEGIVRNRSEWVCKCHGERVYTESRDYYSGVPSCSVIRQALGPDDIERRALPDLIFPHFTGERPANAEDWKP